MNFEDVCKIALAWPGVERSTSYGTPSLKVNGKFLSRLKEDGDSLVIKFVPPDEREMLMQAAPEIFWMTEHYRNWPMVLLRLSRADPATVEDLLLRGWKLTAPKTVVKAFLATGAA